MTKLHCEDFRPGVIAVTGPRLITRGLIVAFAAEFDPQPVPLDEAATSADQHGESVISFIGTSFVERRPVDQ